MFQTLLLLQISICFKNAMICRVENESSSSPSLFSQKKMPIANISVPENHNLFNPTKRCATVAGSGLQRSGVSFLFLMKTLKKSVWPGLVGWFFFFILLFLLHFLQHLCFSLLDVLLQKRSLNWDDANRQRMTTQEGELHWLAGWLVLTKFT